MTQESYRSYSGLLFKWLRLAWISLASNVYHFAGSLPNRSFRRIWVPNKLFQNPMRPLHLLHLTVLVAFVSSCRLSKEYARPELELPTQFNTVSYADTSSIADIRWQNFFTDMALQKLIDRGISYNHDLLMATKRVEMAQQRLAQSKWLQLPEANLQFTAQYNRPSNNSLNGISIKNFLGTTHVENYTALASLSWEADIWGRIRGQKETVLASFLQTAEARKAVQTRIVADIAQGYFNLLMLDAQLGTAQKNLALSDSFLLATRLLKDAGMVNLLAVQQAESQKQSTALLIPQLEENIALQENALQVLTGQLPGAISRSSFLNDFVIPANLSTGLPVDGACSRYGTDWHCKGKYVPCIEHNLRRRPGIIQGQQLVFHSEFVVWPGSRSRCAAPF
jgi:outer membrane protein TolC